MAVPTEVIRSDNGRFVPGHKYVGGHALAAERNRRIAMIAEATDDEQVKRIWQKVLDDAEDGSVPDKQIALAYLLGKPDSQVDPKEAGKLYDAINLNRAPSELTAEQRRARLNFLITEQAKAKGQE